MTRPSLLSRLEAALDYSFEKILDIHTYFHDPAVYPESYREVMTWEQEMVRDGHGGTAFLDKEGRLLGINCYACPLNPDRIAAMLDLKLPDLMALNLNETGVESFAFTDRQPRLMHVNLSQNESLTELRFDFTPVQLRTLHLYDCRVKSLDIPAGLGDLYKLDAARNQQLTKVSFEGGCKALFFLDLSENALTTLELPAGMAALQYVFLRKNKLEKLVFGGGFPKLETLDLRENQLAELPKNFLESTTSLTHLFLYDNPWESIKHAVSSDERGNSCDAAHSFMTSLLGPVDYLFEAKMILVGNGEVGKTSIRKRLIDEKAALPLPEERTQVIEIDRYVVKNLSTEITGRREPKDFVFNVWDFGGQGRYREIQQIFCSHQSLYLFVTAYDDQPELKKDVEDYVSFEYWLDMTSAYGHNRDIDQGSPILIVVNKIDKEYGNVDKARFLKDYPHIHPRDVYISCETMQNFGQLRSAIQELISSISPEVFTTKRNTRWLAVKQALEARKSESYISYEAYLEICVANELDERDARTWIGMLDRIGTVIYFGQHPALRNRIILDPEWVRKAMYAILDSKLLKRGLFNPNMFESIWPDNTNEEREAFVELMIAYKLCYARKDTFGETEYVVPACLPVEQPDLPDFLQTPAYRLQIMYKPFVPAGTVNKLIVTMQRGESLISDPESVSSTSEARMDKSPTRHITVYANKMWKNNVIFHDARTNAYAHVSEDWDNRRVCIDLFGNEVRPLYEQLEAVLHKLNDDLKATRYIRGLSIEAQIEDKGAWINLDYIRKRRELFYHENMTNLQQLITDGEIDRVFELLPAHLDNRDQDTLVLLRSRWNRNERGKAERTIDPRDYDLEVNRITHVLNDFAKNVLVSVAPVPPKQGGKTNASNPRNIYFSYSWKDSDKEGTETQQMIENLLTSLKEDGFPVVRDKEDLPYGGIISQFMKDLGTAPLIVVFTSERYFRSAYCMHELCEIGRNAKWEKELFSTRILPIFLERVDFDSPATLSTYIKHWQEKDREWELFFQENKSGAFPDQNALYERIININQNMGKLGAWVNDINASSLQLLSDNDFALIKTTISQRLSQLDV